MPTSTRFAVAIHSLAAMAVRGGKPTRSEDLAASANTNATVIRALLSRLSEAGLTISQMGAGGGALLAKRPGQIRLLDVYRAVEDSEIFAMHRSPPNPSCPVGRNIQDALRPALEQARRALEKELAAVTIADISAEIARIGKFSLPL
jgi:Rrf2 family protein